MYTLNGLIRLRDDWVVSWGHINAIRYRKANLADHASGIRLGTLLELRGR